MLIRLRAIGSAIAASLILLAQPAIASTAEDTVDVPHLIAAYHAAVVSHDGARLTALFVPTGSAWFSVLSEEGLARARAKSPATTKIRPGSLKAFAKLVATSNSAFDPRHTDLRIASDGAVATVTFKFEFLIDGKVQNRGAESWQLIKGDDGWRIVSIVFSSTPPAI
ncbi:nuclear transport factor 2 family protein [Sphingomonas sp. BK580]|uniref:nuclear transport factor 2 family protein n=1 Tax=Sphingomonas sp. BK580 TaxID=2586972 RepID=UPI0017BDEA76|nr:DUF4440 domain-containing protein [Sphingomonas sp. BK580]MBB3695594.1 hypothetical protein [Sphingomonas sp. BK580]